MIQSFSKDNFNDLEERLGGLNAMALETLRLQGRTRHPDYLANLPKNPSFRELLVVQGQPDDGSGGEPKGYGSILRLSVSIQKELVVFDYADEIIVGPKYQSNGVGRELMMMSLSQDSEGKFHPLLLRASHPDAIASYHRIGTALEKQHGIPYTHTKLGSETHPKIYAVFAYGMDRLPIDQGRSFPMIAQYVANLPSKMREANT